MSEGQSPPVKIIAAALLTEAFERGHMKGKEEVEALSTEAYDKGYEEGYNDGCRDTWASVHDE